MLALLAGAAPVIAQAAQPVARATTQAGSQMPPGPSLLGAFFSLLLVLGLIVGLAWLLRRMPGSGFRQAEGLRVVASLQVGARERVVVVQVGEQQLLLGVTATGISCLHALPEPLPPAEAPKLPDLKHLPNFAQVLAQRLRKDS